MSDLTHFNEEGRARMVDVSAKAETVRVAQVAAIMAAKQTSTLIPMCHPLFLSGIDVTFRLNEEESKVEIRAEVKNTGRTGVEMEALTAVSVAALTIYDMCKAVEKSMEISGICLVSKSGGKSGVYQRA